MSAIQESARVISDPTILFHSQIIQSAFEQPIPRGIVGIELSDPTIGSYIEILDQEIAIYSTSLPGDPVGKRLTATVSIEEAKSLAEKLFSAANGAEDIRQTSILPQPEKHYNPDEYPKAIILYEPDVERLVVDINPAEAAGQTHTVIITSLSADGKTRLPAILLTSNDAQQMSHDMLRVIETIPSRGAKAVEVEEKFHPERVVRF